MILQRLGSIAGCFPVNLFSMLLRVILLIAVFFCGKWSSVFGQTSNTNELPQVSPLSPNAASLLKLEEKPPGSFTGTTPINFLLYELSSGGLKLPVTLNYSNGGIKVEEVASNVGLGFSLSAGGSISRVMAGTPDDYPSLGGMLSGDLPPSQFPGDPWLSNVDKICRNELDVAPDVFYLECNGISGKFFFGEDSVIHFVSQMPVKIEPRWKYINQQGNHIMGWIITDEYGNQYYFGMDKAGDVENVEYTYSSFSSSKYDANVPFSFPYSSRWQLTEIYDMNGENKITLEYDNGYSEFKTLSGAYTRVSGMTGVDCLESDTDGDEVYVTTYTEEKNLRKVMAKNDSLVFYSSLNRLDADGGRLDSIRLFNVFSGRQTGHHFNYDYFVSSGASSGFDAYKKRLKLTDFSQWGRVGEDSLSWTFKYVESVNLPSRLSRSVDYWGYYNGQSNWTFLPNIEFKEGIYNVRIDNFANRRAYERYSIANTLQRITYPTGGYRQFSYEGNQAILGVDTQVQRDGSFYEQTELYSDDFEYAGEFIPIHMDTFMIDSDDGIAWWSYILDGYVSNYGEFQVLVSELEDAWWEGEGVASFENEFEGEADLDNGTYILVVFGDQDCHLSAINMIWEELKLPPTMDRYDGFMYAANMNVGGVRVKQIDDYDPVTDKVNVTRYEYNLFSDTTLTSGLLVTPVILVHVGGCSAFGTRSCQYLRLSSSSHYPLATEGGSYVVYPEVRAIEDGNGYTDTKYSFAFDIAPLEVELDDYPIVPPDDESWQRGKVLWQKIYNEDRQLVAKSASRGIGLDDEDWGGGFAWSDLMRDAQEGWKVVGYYEANGCDHTTGGAPCCACWKSYELHSQFTATIGTKVSTYMPDGQAQQMYTEFEYYTSVGQPLVKAKRVHLHNGDVKEFNYRYGFNASDEFVLQRNSSEMEVINKLNDLHYLQPLEVTVNLIQGDQTTFLEGTEYMFDWFNNDKLHLKTIRQYTSSAEYTDVILGPYDVNGNLEEQYHADDARETFLWGYNHAYPVVKVVGSDYSTVSSYITSPAILQSPVSEDALLDELSNVSVGLANNVAQVSLFTYEPGVGITSITDPSGKVMHYEYDHYNRLAYIRDQDNNILKRVCYSYDGQPTECTLYGSDAISGEFTRSNCGSGYQGGIATYTVPAGTYSAYSKAEANTMAQNDLNTNGQAYANENGSCQVLYYNVVKSGQFTRDNCGSGYVGSTVSYTVSAGTYSTVASQAAADQMAIDDVNNNGQAYANANGTCTANEILLFYQDYGFAVYPYYFRLTNLDTDDEYEFEADSYLYPPYYPILLGVITPGYYLVEIESQLNDGYHSYETCDDYTYTNSLYPDAYLLTEFDETCNTIKVDY